MVHEGGITSSSDINPIRSATSYRETTSDEDGPIGHIIDTQSEEMEEYNDSAESSVQSDFLTPPLTISGRGALISGMAVPSIDSDDELEFEGPTDDVESGPVPPDSDYASHAPPKIFQNTISLKQKQQNQQQKNLMTMAAESYMKRRSETEASEAPAHINIDYSSAASSERPFRTKRFWCILISISCIFIGAIIAISIRASKTGSDNKLTSQQQEISDIAISISGQEQIDDSYSPQRKAYSWIMYDDNQFQDAITPLDRDAVVQRYVLAIFYYATNGPLWTDNNWLQGSECADEWTGIKCNGVNQVIALNLEQQGLSGFLPVEIGHLSFMENFVLKNEGGLAGTIPATVGKLSSLRQINLSHNSLEGSIPPELYLATTLSYINFEVNGMSGSISPDIGKLTELRTLILANNTFDYLIPFDELSKCPMEYIGLSSNNFMGTISPAIQGMSLLRYLYLDRNEKIIGDIPVSMGGVTNLISLNLDFTGISGRIPAILGRLQKLEYLSLQGNGLYGSIPRELNMLHKLKSFNLVGNMLTGEIPNFSALTNLQSLMLVGNRLQGSITDQLANLRSIEYLFLSSNKFTGPIPTSIGRPEGFTGSLLKGLYMSENSFDGNIPESICQYGQLRALFLDDNQLSGSIPSCIGNLLELRQLYAFQNELTGSVPIEISILRELRGLGLEGNILSGEVTNEICELVTSRGDNGFDFWTDCGGTQPEIICPCCNVCCPSDQCV